MAQQLALSASRAMSLFAGSVSSEALVGSAEKPPTVTQPTTAGLQAVADFIENNVPEAEREKAGEVLIRILNGALFELVQMTRAQAGLKPLELSDKTQAYMMQTVLSLSERSYLPGAYGVYAEGLHAGTGQRFPGGACARQNDGLSGLRFLDFGRVCHALHPRTPCLGMACHLAVTHRETLRERRPPWRCPPTAKPWMATRSSAI